MRKGSTAPGYLRQLGPYYRQLRGLLVVGSICAVAMNVFVILPPLLLGRAINVALSVEKGTATAGAVGVAAIFFVAGTAATEVPRVGKRYWLGVARTRFVASIRADALRGVLEWPSDVTATHPVGDVMARIIGDVDVVGTGVGEVIVETWDTLLFSLSLTATMVALSPSLALFALLPVPVALILAQRSGVAIAKRTRRARESESILTTELREQISTLRLLRLFGRVAAATAQVGERASDQARRELDVIWLSETLSAVYAVLLASGVIIIVAVGGTRVVRGEWSLGALVSFLALFFRFVNRAPRIPQMVNRVQAGGASFQRLLPLLAPPLDVPMEPRWWTLGPVNVPGATTSDAPTPPASSGPEGLELRHVSYSYPHSAVPALVDVDVSVSPGAFVAVTGPVASGKSALARLAAGLTSPSDGRVVIGGISSADITPQQRASTVGFLGQEPHLFSGSVAENVAMWAFDDPGGPSAQPRAQVLDAITLSALDRDLRTLPRGIETQVGELGVRISGGQRQRIGLARALGASGRRPGLLVLDDPFSASDVDTEAQIVASLRQALGSSAPIEQRCTVVLISHRLAAFPLADLILVLDGGRIVERGTHVELVAAGGLYARISRAQAVLDALPPKVDGS